MSNVKIPFYGDFICVVRWRGLEPLRLEVRSNKRYVLKQELLG